MLSFAALLAVTFYADVLPILERRCLGCHQAGEAAPMPLGSFAEARPFAKAIRDAVLQATMPPGGGLPAAEAAVLRQWAARPAPGPGARPAVLPVRPSVRDDLTLRMPAPFPVPPGATVDYQHFVLPTGQTTPRWVQAIEIRPGNRRVVHHAVAFVRTARSEFLRGGRLSVEDEVLGTYLPGEGLLRWPAGQAKLLPAGAEIVLQMHYTATGKPEEDQTALRLEFGPPPRERVYTLSIAQWDFAIPPFAPAHPVTVAFPVQTGVRVLAVTPHMHLRGRSMRVTAGDAVVLDLPRYRFDWQLRRVLPRPVELAAGEVIRVEATFDNSPNNPRNPDPAATVRWGEQSWQEMMVAFVDVAIPAAWPPAAIYRPKRF
ncbi:MAG: hypothetical protein ACK58M_24280 [Acidobacteriota bacterium]|jgi:hypothetical protein|nr:hypothetical protein [Acidobacteriaceae bacterium]